jgi:hypothetical protein
MARTSKKALMHHFIKLIEDFVPRHSGRDLLWNFIVREKREWIRVRVQKYENTYYITADGSDVIAWPDARYEESAATALISTSVLSDRNPMAGRFS